MSLRIPILVIALGAAFSSAQAGDPIDLDAAIKKAIPVPNPAKPEDIKWLLGYWTCSERAIWKQYHDRLQEIRWIDFRDATPEVIEGARKGLVLRPACRSSHNDFYSETVSLSDNWFVYGGVMADFCIFNRDPADPPAWFLLEQSVSHDFYLFRRAKAIDGDAENPSYADVIQAGDPQATKEDLQTAIGNLSKVIEADPNNSVAYNKRGIAKLRNGDVDGAIVDFTAAAQIAPESYLAYANRGFARFKKGAKESLDDYARAIALAPKEARLFAMRGYLELAFGDGAAASKDFDRAIALDGKRADFFSMRGRAKQSLENANGAKEDFARAKELDAKAGPECLRISYFE